MSAVDQDFGTSLLPRVEFHINRLKAAIIGGGAVAAGILIAYPPAAHRSLLGPPQEICAAAIALTGAAILVAVGLYILMRMLLWRGPAVVIDGYGIHDRRTGSIMTPWSRIHDIRVLDRHGHHIGIDTLAEPPASSRRPVTWPLSMIHFGHAEPITIIDTYFLHTVTGNRILDFVMPLTALTPIDMSETPVSERTLTADADFARNRMLSVFYFVVSAGLIPAAATILIIV